MKLSLCALILSATFFASNTALANDICNESKKSICDDTTLERAISQKKVSQINDEIIAQALPEINRKVNEFLAKTPKFRWIKRITQPMRIKNQEIMKIAKKKFPEIDSFINDSNNQSRIKNYMTRSIENSSFNNATKYSMKSIIAQVRMISYSDYIDLVELDESLLKNMTMNACGASGLEVNAFAIEIKKRDYVVICPGFIINNSYGKSKEEMFENSLFVLGHELGHHIDSRKLGLNTYTNYLSCMTKNHIANFNPSDKDAKFCLKNKTTYEECSSRIINSHAGELIGDVWGMKIINEYAKEQASGIYESSLLLTKGMGALCGGKDVGLHPSGDFRTGKHLAINPEMNELFNCNETQVTCNF